MTGPIDPRFGIGSIPHDGGTTFRVWAPHADAVAVTGSFDEWSGERHPLTADAGGFWSGFVGGAHVGDQYQFVVFRDGERLMRVDPRARAVTNSVGNAIVYDRHAFDWDGDEFSCPPHHELVIYETHIGSFVAGDGKSGNHGKSGDLAAMAGKLGYLSELGVNAIELMPVAEFAGDYSWGYNPSHPFAVERSYGGPDQLKEFVREAHRHGIAVILDVVLNHFGPSDLGLWRFDGWSENGGGGIYFYNDDRAATPWGRTRPDYGRDEVRAYLRDNALMWLEEYHLDGLRFDATLYIRTIDGVGTDDLPDGWQLMRSITSSIRERHPDTILIAEDLQGNRAITAPADGGGGEGGGGAGFHAQWDAGFVHRVRRAIITSDDGARSMTELADAVRGEGDPFTRIVYTESHDDVANGKLRVPHEIDADDPSSWAAQKRSTLGLAIVLTTPGIPMLFQGQEFLEDEWFRDHVPLDWQRAERFRDIVRLTRDLIHLRRNTGGISAGLSGGGFALLHLDDAAKTLAWARSARDDLAVVVVNAGATARDITLGVPASGRWAVRFNSDAATYSPLFAGQHTGDVDAADDPLDGQPARAVVSVGAYTLVVLTRA